MTDKDLVCDVLCPCGWGVMVKDSRGGVSQAGVAGEVAASHEGQCGKGRKNGVQFNWTWK